MIKLEDFIAYRNYLFCHVDNEGIENRETYLISDYEELKIKFNNMKGTDKEVMLVSEAYNNGIGFPDEDFYDEETDSFREN